MPKFEVLIMETLEDIVTVEAENEEEALEKVEDGWEDETYILGPENFTGLSSNCGMMNGAINRKKLQANSRTCPEYSRIRVRLDY